MIGEFPRIQIVGTHSGCGKTTVSCAILSALCTRGMKLSSFKCGPDYIDPMFHEKMMGAHSRNLDIFMNGEENILPIFIKNAKNSDFSVIEGVMGMYDGIEFGKTEGSSNHISLLTKTPQILVVNVRGMSSSLLAILKGYLEFRKNNIKGIILNGCTKMSYEKYAQMIKNSFDTEVFGYFPRNPDISLESRHLGLVTASETADIQKKVGIMGEMAEEYIELDKIIELGKKAQGLESDNEQKKQNVYNINIAVAKDNAFCFIYEDNIDILKEFGAKITYFSPLFDQKLPENADALMLFGGYPEEYAKKLSKNEGMKKSITDFAKSGKPIYAECGGFMYLLKSMEDKNGETFDMCGVFDGKSFMTKSLKRFGYVSLTAKKDNILCKKGETIKGHEFHYSDSTNNGEDFCAEKRGKSWNCIICTENIFAGYPHIHFGAYKNYIENFIKYSAKVK